MVGVGLVLLVGHGMAFLFACTVAGGLMLVASRSMRDLAVRLAPLCVLGCALVVFLLATKGFDTPLGDIRFIWGFDPVGRALSLFALSHGFTVELAMVSAGLLLVPWALGSRPNPAVAWPFAVLVVWVLTMPKDMLGAVHWGERFGMFTMPFFALLWSRSTAERSLRSNVAAVALVAGCWASLGVMALRLHQFGKESMDFEIVLAAAEPSKRALSIGSDNSSKAALHPFLYVQHAAWYAADKQGLVDYDFASLHNLIVRFRSDHRPPLDVDFVSHSHNVDWHRHRARDYDYYFVRHGQRAIPPQLVANGECSIDAVASSGAWTLLKRGACKD